MSSNLLVSNLVQFMSMFGPNIWHMSSNLPISNLVQCLSIFDLNAANMCSNLPVSNLVHVQWLGMFGPIIWNRSCNLLYEVISTLFEFVRLECLSKSYHELVSNFVQCLSLPGFITRSADRLILNDSDSKATIQTILFYKVICAHEVRLEYLKCVLPFTSQ